MNARTETTRDAATRRDGATMLPPVDVIEDASGITLFADLPGVPRDKLHLEIQADTLTIEGDVSLPVPDDMVSTHAEISIPRYRRVFTLSKELDGANVTAELANGVLTLRIPKTERAQPRRIEIRGT